MDFDLGQGAFSDAHDASPYRAPLPIVRPLSTGS